ncbi:lactadherin-like [Oculina patagonica]
MALRFELYGCTQGFEPPKLECQSDLGMKNGKIPDSAITASSSYSQRYGPERARLGTMQGGSYTEAWVSRYLDEGQWIQVDLENITKITLVATQGKPKGKQWVKSYSITYSVEGGPFLPYNDNQVLSGNEDSNTIIGHILNPPIIARYIRIHPKDFRYNMALRFELYGCTEGFPIPEVPACQIPLGMQNGKLPNSALSASSQYNAHLKPKNARLHFHREGRRHGAWVAKMQDDNQWLQVDFGVATQITVIATQGRQDADQWVTKYTLRYSTDGSFFEQYQPDGLTKIFQGNTDRYAVVSHNLIPPIRACYIRIVPVEWHSRIALRAEFYGCKTASWKPIGCYKMTSRALDTYLVRAGNITSISKRYQACEKKADEEGITLFGMDDKRCWTSDDAGRSYDKFGPSEHCKEKAGYSSGISERFSLYVYRKNDKDAWKAVGCYLNSGPRALPKPFDKNVRSVSGNDAVFEYCKAKAEEFAFETFGVDDQACWSGDKAEETYDDYGKSDRCSVSQKTGNGSGKELNGDMFVYQLSK